MTGAAESVSVELDSQGSILALYNEPLLHSWLAPDAPPLAQVGSPVASLLHMLFGPLPADQLARSLTTFLHGGPECPPFAQVRPGRQLQAGVAARHFKVELSHPAGSASSNAVLMLGDDSLRIVQEQALEESRALYETAMTVLRAKPEDLRVFLGAASASVGALRATYRMPARSQDAVRDKLERLRAEAVTLAEDAGRWQLAPVTRACCQMTDAIATVIQDAEIRGDDLLPLAPQIDAIANAVGRTWRIDEQRPESLVTATTAVDRTGVRIKPKPAWAEASRRRWGEFLRRRGDEAGLIARLELIDAEVVPAALRRPVEEILMHLLGNALEHGIETPEHRLAVHKSAAGQVTVKFDLPEPQQLRMTVHDNGRGFDLNRIGRAAVQCGLLTEQELADRNDADLVGLVFKSAFTTAELPESQGKGRGMAFLRKVVTRLNGQVTLATKPGRYTLFTVQLPLPSESSEASGQVRSATP